MADGVVRVIANDLEGGSGASRTSLRCCPSGSPAGMKMVRDATGEQRSRRPIFIATRWAVAGWLFFRGARSARIDPDMGASLAP